MTKHCDTGTTGAHRTELHENLMRRFESEFVMDMLIAIIDAIGAGFFSKYNLLTLELVHLILRGYDPKAAVMCANDKTNGDLTSTKKKKKRSDHFGSMMANDIRQRKQREAQLRGRRHSRFGGVLKLSMFGGTAQAVTTAPLSEVMRNPNEVLQKQQPKARRPTRAVRSIRLNTCTYTLLKKKLFNEITHRCVNNLRSPYWRRVCWDRTRTVSQFPYLFTWQR